MEKVFIRVNGRGNAWPIQLGLEHPYYQKTYGDTANASFSFIKSKEKEIKKDLIQWEVLVDAGHGAVQHLIKAENRIPEAIVLTHAHHDHTYGIDWVVQSFYRQNDRKKKYPVYVTKLAWECVVQSYPHLEDLVDFREIKAGETTTIENTDLLVTPYPVYHGESANGASMLVFEHDKSKAIITGDLLCPLLRKKDFQHTRFAKYLFVDANNRFPFPACNHWSIVGDKLAIGEQKLLEKWQKGISLSHFIATNLPKHFDKAIHGYFDELLAEQLHERELHLNIFDFADEFKPTNVCFVHYSGMEDLKHYQEEQMMDFKLAHWANQLAKENEIKSTFHAPKVGDLFEL